MVKLFNELQAKESKKSSAAAAQMAALAMYAQGYWAIDLAVAPPPPRQWVNAEDFWGIDAAVAVASASRSTSPALDTSPPTPSLPAVTIPTKKKVR